MISLEISKIDTSSWKTLVARSIVMPSKLFRVHAQQIVLILISSKLFFYYFPANYSSVNAHQIVNINVREIIMLLSHLRMFAQISYS